jgi:hypothetical protein
MSDDDVALLLNALGVVAFERDPGGAFRPLVEPPLWFAALGRDGTFPFLGHILEEATAFWATRTDGVRAWGPCADVAADGKEFHYLVKAATVGARTYLLFQIDESVDQLRAVLQAVRSDALKKQPPQS